MHAVVTLAISESCEAIKPETPIDKHSDSMRVAYIGKAKEGPDCGQRMVGEREQAAWLSDR